jgi:multiple sugar transport system permease protein
MLAAGSRRTRRSASRAARRTVLLALVALTLLWSLFPLYWMLVTAFKSNLEIFDLGLELVPRHVTLANFQEIATGTSPIGRFFVNSVITSVATAVVTVVFSLLAAYALSRLRVKGGTGIMLSVLSAQMFPLVVLLIPLYVIFRASHLLNSYAGLVLSFTSFAIPLGIWLMKGFVDSIPRELDEAAMIDGCNTLQILRHVIVPLLLPGLVAVAVFAFLDAWNNLLFPLTLITQVDLKTLPPGLLNTVSGEFKHDWGGLMAASIVASVPPIVVFVLLQRYLMKGLIAGALKS